jgi:endonuclease/exonuclease/phosphatase family metal-dependent hydrolase
MKTTIVESSGRFDRPLPSLAASVERLRGSHVQGHPVSLIVGTETHARPDSFLKGDPDWGFSHMPGFEGETWVTWDLRVWAPDGHPRSHTLSTLTWVRSPEYGGKEAPPVRVQIVPLRPVAGGPKVFVLATHMPLSNTPLRRMIWAACARGLVRRIRKHLRKNHPGCKIILAGDFNKNYRLTADREALDAGICKPLALRSVWSGHVPAHGGTHGPRSILDNIFTDLPVHTTEILPDDDSSDHGPFGAVVEV